MTTTTAHSHHSSTALTVGGPDPLCDVCGRSMAEIRAERQAAADAKRRPAVTNHPDPMGGLIREMDNERRRARYRRTGR